MNTAPAFMPDIKLRLMLTRPAVGATKKVDGEEEASGVGSASPTARERRRRLYVKPSGGLKGRTPAEAQTPAATTVLQESLVVVKESANPEDDFRASMAEMIEANDDVCPSPRVPEELLACYLALNAAEHHRAIVAAFRHTWPKYRPDWPLEADHPDEASSRMHAVLTFLTSSSPSLPTAHAYACPDHWHPAILCRLGVPHA